MKSTVIAVIEVDTDRLWEGDTPVEYVRRQTDRIIGGSASIISAEGLARRYAESSYNELAGPKRFDLAPPDTRTSWLRVAADRIHSLVELVKR